MSKETTLNVHLNKDVKERAAKVARGMGLDLNTVVNLFLVEMSNTNQLPFTPTGYSKFPGIWSDNPQEIAHFNQHIGLTDDGSDFGNETAD
ncbi:MULTISPECIES: type II toxin-antitoxin system RelB/DinJ family antitoxin [Lactobacillaceae]|uniref:type II toxin-antitoxin system RelB/DinJ family antitoxin n=1 Tax=Lactobacillaceae TaxID=33958 RepID=UPI001456D6C1|nr:type II toxin-antitoxin system RelB/DinJ family antitoxin [Lactobacillus sp. HBUAS51381]NLR10425.1 hypothetical protein [Lactobacillus sp. HBUAS51381]